MSGQIMSLVLTLAGAQVSGLETPAGARVYPYEASGVYPVIATPGRITDIVLEPGETLVGTGPIAAGDTARWVIGDTSSGTGEGRRVHVLVKPTLPNLATNLIINSDRRTYHVELRASARTWNSQVSWRYEQPAPIASAVVEKAAVASVEPVRLNEAYRIEGDRPLWRPTGAFDDGQRVYVEFGAGVALSDLPPLYVLGADGKTPELVNYQVEGRRIVVDRLFDRAELRFGGKTGRARVRLVREKSLSEAVR